MKKYITFLAFLSIVFSLQAQETDDETTTKKGRDISTFLHIKGSHNFNLGVGFPNLANSTFNIVEGLGGGDRGSASPNFTFKYEYGITDELGAGLHIGYYTAKTPTVVSDVLAGDFIGIIEDLGCLTGLTPCDTLYATEDGGTGYDRIHSTTVGARVAYRRGELFGIEKLDVYATALFGYAFLRRKRVGDANANVANVSPTQFVYNASAGARYFITPAIGIYGELGYGSLTILNMGLTYRILPKAKE